MGTISFKIDADTQGAQGHLKDLKRRIEDTFKSDSIKHQTSEMEALTKSIQSTYNAAEKLSKEIDTLKDTKVPTREYSELEEVFNRTRDRMAEVRAEGAELIKRWGKAIISSENFNRLDEEYTKLIQTYMECTSKAKELIETNRAFTTDTFGVKKLEGELSSYNRQLESEISLYTELGQKQQEIAQQAQAITKTPAKLPIEVETNQLQERLDHVKQRVEQAFNTDPIINQNAEVVKLSGVIKNTTSEVDRLVGEIDKVKDAKIPTAEYDKLQRELDETETKLAQAEAKAKEFWDNAGAGLRSSIRASQEGNWSDLGLKGPEKLYHGLTAQADQLKASIENIKAEMQSMVQSGTAFKIDTTQVDKLEAKLTKTLDLLDGQVGRYEQLKAKEAENLQILQEHQLVLDGIRNNGESYNETITKTIDRLREVKNQYNALLERQQLLEEAGHGIGYSEYDANLSKMAQLQEEHNQLNRAVQEYQSSLARVGTTQNDVIQKTVTWKDYVNEVKSTYKDMTNAIKKVGSFVKDTINSFKQIGNAVKNVVNRIKDMVTHTKLFNAMANHSHKPWYKTAWTIAKALIGVRGLYMLIRKLRTAIVTGFTNLTKESVQARGQLDLLRAKFLQLKNSVGAAIAPLVAQITPMIQRIIDLFTQAFNAVAMFFGALTGKSSVKTAKFLDSSYGVEEDKSSGGKKGETAQEKYDKAVKKAEEKYQKDLAKYNEKVAKAEQKQADADAKLTDSKEKLNKQLQGFDELNNLTTNDLDDSADAYKDYLADIGEPPELEMPNMEDYLDAATGGGAGSKIMFEDTPIGSFFDTMADWLKNMWKLGDFTDLGTLLGTQLKKFLDDIPWQKYQDFAEKLGRALATLINGFIEVDGLGYSIGKTFAEGLNTIVHAVDAFVSSLHWASVGHFIADTFNGFFENIDWDLIYHTVVTGLRGLALAINQFIADFHWENLSTTIANLINTAIAGVYIFFSKTEFDTLGLRIAEQIIASVQKIDWKKAGEATGAVLQGLLDLVLAMIHYLKEHKEEVKQAFMDFWHGLCEELDFGDVAELMLTALKVALLLKIPAIMTGIGAAILAGLKLGLSGSIFSAGSIGGGFKAFLGGLFGKGAVAEATAAGTEVGTAAGTAIGESTATAVGASTAGVAAGIAAVGAAAVGVLAITGEKYAKDMAEKYDLSGKEIALYGKTLERYNKEYSEKSADIMQQSDQLMDSIVAGTVEHTAAYSHAMKLKVSADKNAYKTTTDLQIAQKRLDEALEKKDYLNYQGLKVPEDVLVTIDAASHEVEILTKVNQDALEAQSALNGSIDELAHHFTYAHKQTKEMNEAWEQLTAGEITWMEYVEKSNKIMSTQPEVKSKEQINAAIELQKANNNLIGSYDEYNDKVRTAQQLQEHDIDVTRQRIEAFKQLSNNTHMDADTYQEQGNKIAGVVYPLSEYIDAVEEARQANVEYTKSAVEQQQANNNLVGDYTKYNEQLKAMQQAEQERVQSAISQQMANNNLIGNYRDYNAQLRLQEEEMANVSAITDKGASSLVDMSFRTQESAKSLADASLNAKRYAEEQANLQMMNNNLIGDYTQYNEKLRETATVMDELDTQLSAGGRRRPSPFDEEFMTETDEGINKLKEVPTALDEVNTALDTFSETAGTTLAESFGTLSETIVTTFSETFTTKFEEFKTTTTETLTLWVTDLQTQLSETFLTQVELLMSNIILYLQESYLTHLEEFRLLAMQMVMDMTLAMQEQWLIDQFQWDLLIYNIIFTMQNALMIYKPLLITDLLTFCNEILTNVMTALGCSGGGEGGQEGGGGHSTKFYEIMVQCLQGFIDAVAEKGPEALEVIGGFCEEAAGYFASIGDAALGAVASVQAAMTALANMDMGNLSSLGGGKFSISSGGFNFNVGGFANGTVIPPNAQKFLGVLGDNNRETEVVSPLSTMTQAMTQALANAGFNNGGNNGDIVINMDGYEVFRVVRRENEKYRMSTGMSGF